MTSLSSEERIAALEAQVVALIDAVTLLQIDSHPPVNLGPAVRAIVRQELDRDAL